MNSTSDLIDRARQLREEMIGELRRLSALRTDRVADAFRAVPRHLFAPESPLESAYDPDRSVVVKRDTGGAATSTVSAPAIQATMLEQADIEPGTRVLEIGSGGYNAALIAELVGTRGHVVTVDIDPDVVARTRRFLDEAGYPGVRAVHADAEHGVPHEAPFDRIIVTVGAWDIPPTWWNQLVEDGLMVLPLRLRGLTRSVSLRKVDGALVDRDHHQAGFVAIQGAGAHDEVFVPLAGDEVGLRVDDAPPADPAALAAALARPRVEQWSGVEIAGTEPFDGLDLYLATHTAHFGILMALQSAVDRRLVSRWARWGAPTCFSDQEFAYRVTRRAGDSDRAELGVFAHGPDADALAREVTALIRTWDRDHRLADRRARITVLPAGTPDAALPAGFALTRKHTRIVVSWPGAT
ncbi:methyltransferase, FxLD system [Actinokineospora sp. NBRC 105648]|uniref:methyltransferase, FxLD system n=1 Tax=Actinokineospora sp. NBRC 105648 TaxID=3032206 RepID=UPI0024A56C5F|nr:methyltransferase, FxLD system [Actinokineospora sp. NBRC 105648]GLZ42648.1 hypothetical protein Acsp05_62720 [Actinokineospora sp. NBRC 105648]